MSPPVITTFFVILFPLAGLSDTDNFLGSPVLRWSNGVPTTWSSDNSITPVFLREHLVDAIHEGYYIIPKLFPPRSPPGKMRLPLASLLWKSYNGFQPHTRIREPLQRFAPVLSLCDCNLTDVEVVTIWMSYHLDNFTQQQT